MSFISQFLIIWSDTGIILWSFPRRQLSWYFIMKDSVSYWELSSASWTGKDLLRVQHLTSVSHCRSPPHLLTEVLLIDDSSDLERHPELGAPLEDWSRGEEKVRLVRNVERQGLIRSKNTGAQESHGEVVVFLDAHCEVNVNWLPPLLAPIAEDEKTVSVPIIDVLGVDKLLISILLYIEISNSFLFLRIRERLITISQLKITQPSPTVLFTQRLRSQWASGSGDFCIRKSGTGQRTPQRNIYQLPTRPQYTLVVSSPWAEITSSPSEVTTPASSSGAGSSSSSHLRSFLIHFST